MSHSGHTMLHGHSAAGPSDQPAAVTHDETSINSDHMSMSMKMFFHTGYEKNIVIYGWDADTDFKMIGTVLAVFVLALVYEGIKFYRIHYSQLSASTPSRSLRSVPGRADSDSETTVTRRRLIPHMIESLLYAAQVAISFTLMLFVMTFNLWIVLSAVLGMAAGYALFSSSVRINSGNGSEDCCS